MITSALRMGSSGKDNGMLAFANQMYSSSSAIRNFALPLFRERQAYPTTILGNFWANCLNQLNNLYRTRVRRSRVRLSKCKVTSMLPMEVTLHLKRMLARAGL